MASVIDYGVDLGLLTSFRMIFVFLLVYTLSYGIFEWQGIFGKERKDLHAFMSLGIAVLTTASPIAREVVGYMIPWVILIVIAAFLMIMILKVFGVSDTAIETTVSKDSTITTWVIIIVVIIFFAAMGKVFFATGQPLLETGIQINQSQIGSGEGEVAFWDTLFHPKVLGLIMIMIIASITIKLLAGDVVRPSAR